MAKEKNRLLPTYASKSAANKNQTGSSKAAPQNGNGNRKLQLCAQSSKVAQQQWPQKQAAPGHKDNSGPTEADVGTTIKVLQFMGRLVGARPRTAPTAQSLSFQLIDFVILSFNNFFTKHRSNSPVYSLSLLPNQYKIQSFLDFFLEF